MEGRRDYLFVPSPNMLPLSCDYLAQYAGFTKEDFYKIGLGDKALRTSSEWHELYKRYYGEVVTHATGWLDVSDPKWYWANIAITSDEYRARVAKSRVVME